VRHITVSVATTVDVQGHVERAEPQLVDADGPPEVGATIARCIAGEVQTWQFPAPDKQQVLMLPFHLIRQ
jgi:hypothetical protein